MSSIVHGSFADVLPGIQSGSAQTVVTSPPYFNQRRYDGDQGVVWPEVAYSPMPGIDDIVVGECDVPFGTEGTVSGYVGHTVFLFRLLRDVLRDDGIIWYVVGDSFAQSGNKDGIPRKSIMGVPWRIFLALQADGWVVRCPIVWAKGLSLCKEYSGSSMPNPVKDRPTMTYEYIMMITKNQKYFYDYEAVAEDCVIDVHNAPRFGGNKYGDSNEAGSHYSGRVYTGKDKRNMRSVWVGSPARCKQAHFAVFPEWLVDVCIRASIPKDRGVHVVLDPFCGTGTVGVVSARYGCAFIGVDISDKYVEMAKENIQGIM